MVMRSQLFVDHFSFRDANLDIGNIIEIGVLDMYELQAVKMMIIVVMMSPERTISPWIMRNRKRVNTGVANLIVSL